MARDMKWLQMRGPTFYFVRAVPRPLRPIVGSNLVLKSLQTHDHATALKRRLVAAVDFNRAMDEAAAGPRQRATGPTASALEWRTITAALPPAAREEAQGHIADEAEAIAAKHDHETAQDFFELATGKTTPLLHHVEPWLSEGGTRGPVKAHTAAQYRPDLTALRSWLEKEGIAPTVESLNRKVVGRYVTATLAPLNRATANRKITAASSYWRWMMKRGFVDENPWTGQSFAKLSATNGKEDAKRPLTDAEVKALLGGPANEELADAIRLALLTGARIGEIYGLTVKQCAGGWFDIRSSKSRAGVRRVPIHADLASIVERRTKGKAPSAFLMHEADTTPQARKSNEGRSRAMAISKRFGRYRKALGVDEARPGQLHSLVDLHSARRWFITQARRNFPQDVVASIVGHAVGNMTDDVYSGGPTDERKVACVASVLLP